VRTLRTRGKPAFGRLNGHPSQWNPGTGPVRRRFGRRSKQPAPVLSQFSPVLNRLVPNARVRVRLKPRAGRLKFARASSKPPNLHPRSATPALTWPARILRQAARVFDLVVILATLTIGAGCTHIMTTAAVYDPDSVEIPPLAVPRARMPREPIPALLKLPQGRGPFPVVIVLHGCGGRGPSQLTWAHRLNGWGYAALIPDSMTPRGVTRVCEPESQPFVTPRDRVGDVGSAVAWLRTRPEIDPTRIAVLGQSHGGAAAALATESIYDDFRLKAAVDYYGACIEPEAHGTVPLLVLAGEADDWGHPALRCEAYGEAVGSAQPFEIHTYPGVHHAFENPDMVGSVSGSHVLQYDAAAAEDSFVRVHDFLDRWVKNLRPLSVIRKPAARGGPAA
jgi:dienelactone hydrolase